ncbi:MAG TPA: response regulator [Methylomirabilota bacterium]|nr:response regulator [Methylomirabilota bacterium]
MGHNHTRTNKRVLLVDDDAMVLSVVREMLEVDAHRVETATNGLEAIQRLERGGFDLVITDIRMPELDGFGLYRAIENRWPELCERVLFIATPRDDDATRDFLAETAVSYLAKPFGLTDLRRVVDVIAR